MSKRVNGYAIGIDLGTTYSCVAIWLSRKKRVEIIPNEQGNMITPSCVAFNDSELLVGESAKYQIARNPANTVFDVKRLIRNRFSDSQVQNDMKMWPFKVIKGDSDKPSVVVEFKGKKKFTPKELSVMVLKKMKETAKLFLRKKVKNVVITVPAYFNSQQREETKEAGIRAGLNVLCSLSEPTAAAIAYGGVDSLSDTNWNKDKKTVLVFDLGGGTFDVSLLTAPIEIDCLHEGIDFSTKISRAKFEELNATYFNKCIQLLKECLRDGDMKKRMWMRSLNGDEAVASGAAILAARLSGSDADMNKDVVLVDVISRSLKFVSMVKEHFHYNRGECPTPHAPLLLHVDLQSYVKTLMAFVYSVLAS
nr:hypothetical protein [Tanacetum cinerariifolium]